MNISAAVKRSIETHPVESRDLHKVTSNLCTYNMLYGLLHNYVCNVTNICSCVCIQCFLCYAYYAHYSTYTHSIIIFTPYMQVLDEFEDILRHCFVSCASMEEPANVTKVSVYVYVSTIFHVMVYTLIGVDTNTISHCSANSSYYTLYIQYICEYTGVNGYRADGQHTLPRDRHQRPRSY